MEKSCEIRLVGSGGQGLILCAVILAKAALKNGVYVAQSQSYGAAARGGACRAEVIFSEAPIDFPKVEQSDFLLALTQSALDQYISTAKPGSFVMYDDSLVWPANDNGCTPCALPILETARTEVGREMCANIVALGAINGYLKLAQQDALEEIVKISVPKGTDALNLKALHAGIALVSK